MFGKYFKHVLVLTLLAGTAYSLPQVKDAMVGAFSFPQSGEAMVVNYNGSTTRVNMVEGGVEMNRPPVVIRQQMMPVPPRNVISPEEVIAILFKAGVISKEKLPLALKIVKEHASSTKIVSPFNASTTPPFSSSTRPINRPVMKDSEVMNRDNVRQQVNPVQARPAELQDVKIEVI